VQQHGDTIGVLLHSPMQGLGEVHRCLQFPPGDFPGVSGCLCCA
jgi:hypothetical protein